MGNINPSLLGGSQNAWGIVDSRYPNRWLDAWGNVDKEIVGTYRAADWTVTATGTSPVAASLLPGAKVLITCQNVDYSGDNMQILGSRFSLASGKPLYFGAQITCSNATTSDFVVGLFGVDTTLTNASSSHALNVGAGGVGFTKIAAVTAGYFKTFTTATEKNSASAFTLDTNAHWYEFFWDGAVLYGYVDAVLVATFGSDLTTEVLTPSICFRTSTTTAHTCTIHDMVTIQVRA